LAVLMIDRARCILGSLAIASFAVACDPPPVAAAACPTEPLVAYGGFQAEGVLEVVVVAPFKSSSSVREFDTVQPEDVTGAALVHQSGDNYLRVSLLPQAGSKQVIVQVVQLCAPSGTDPTDGSLYPHFSLIVDLPADQSEGVPVHVEISEDGAV
jgi:hypothetical protein